MSDQKISADATVTPGGADFIPIVQSGANKKATIASLPISDATQTALDSKVDKTTTVNGKALSSNVTLTTDDFSEGPTNKYDQVVAILAGAGIQVTGTYPNFTVTNSSPDQVVALTAGTNITITGTYPNFTINSGGGSQCEPLVDYSGSAIIGVLGTYVFDSSKTGSKYSITVDSIPVGSNLIVELRKNSYTTGNVLSSTLQIATTDTLTNGKKTVSITDTDSYVAGDYVVAYLTSVGSTTPALNPYFTMTIA